MMWDRCGLFHLPATGTELALSLICQMEVRVFFRRIFVKIKLYSIEAMSNTPLMLGEE